MAYCWGDVFLYMYVVRQMQEITQPHLWSNHGLINFVDPKAKWCHLIKMTCKGTLWQVFIRVYRLDTFSHVGIFDPA
jgi:hypothetical protein